MKRRKNYYYLAAPSRVLTRRAIRKQFTDGRCLVILTLLYLAVLSLYSLLLLVILLGVFFMRLCVFFAVRPILSGKKFLLQWHITRWLSETVSDEWLK